MKTGPGGWFNIKMLSYQYRKSHCGDKTILRPSYLHNGVSYTGKTTSLYWIRALYLLKHGIQTLEQRLPPEPPLSPPAGHGGCADVPASPGGRQVRRSVQGLQCESERTWGERRRRRWGVARESRAWVAGAEGIIHNDISRPEQNGRDFADDTLMV